jgi:hypothetical protein
VADAGAGLPGRERARFQIASASRQFAAIAAMLDGRQPGDCRPCSHPRRQPRRWRGWLKIFSINSFFAALEGRRFVGACR